MENKTAYLLSIFSGILLGLSWNRILPVWSLFIAFVPLLFVVQNTKLHYSQIFNYSFISFLLFHLGTVWWLCKASIIGGLSIMILNSSAMSLVMTLVHIIRQKSNSRVVGILAFIFLWLSFEYIHFNWELSWPFMNLGNWIGQLPKVIQWYEFTGILGGSLWILISNSIVYQILNSYRNRQRIETLIMVMIEIIIIIIPILLSNSIHNKPELNGTKVKFAIIQPNINPYTEKYNSSLFKQQINRQIQLANKADSSEKTYILYPESSFPKYINEDEFKLNDFTQNIYNQLVKNNNKIIIASCYTYKLNKKDTIYYNTSFMIDHEFQPEIYHKSKLVIGVEKMPFDSYFNFLKKFNLDFGGFTTSLGTDKNQRVFSSSTDSFKIAPVICYESVYGEFVTGFVQKGANCIVVQTNDAWWSDTPGYKQHLMHSQLRAIENRKAIARSANTGTSCFIDCKGKIYSRANDWQEDILINSLSMNNCITYYAYHGDFIGRFALIFSLLIIVLVWTYWFYKKYNLRK